MAKPLASRRELGERRAPRARRHPPGEQQGLEPERREPAREVLRVLFCEQFRRRHQRDLETGLDGVRGRERGDDRLAGADVALHEAHHRVRHGEVRTHFPEDALLRAGQREAGAGEQRPGEPAVRADGNGGVAADRRAQLPERELLREQLLEGEAPLRRMAAGREHVELAHPAAGDARTDSASCRPGKSRARPRSPAAGSRAVRRRPSRRAPAP